MICTQNYLYRNEWNHHSLKKKRRGGVNLNLKKKKKKGSE